MKAGKDFSETVYICNVEMMPEVKFYNIFMNLYYKNILKYAKIARSEPKSMILNIEGRSNGHF